MQKPRISRHITPTTGWKFLNRNFWIYGDTFEELVSNVILHRTNNGYPLGDTIEEIEDQLAENNPHFIIKHLS